MDTETVTFFVSFALLIFAVWYTVQWLSAEPPA